MIGIKRKKRLRTRFNFLCKRIISSRKKTVIPNNVILVAPAAAINNPITSHLRFVKYSSSDRTTNAVPTACTTYAEILTNPTKYKTVPKTKKFASQKESILVNFSFLHKKKIAKKMT